MVLSSFLFHSHFISFPSVFLLFFSLSFISNPLIHVLSSFHFHSNLISFLFVFFSFFSFSFTSNLLSSTDHSIWIRWLQITVTPLMDHSRKDPHSPHRGNFCHPEGLEGDNLKGLWGGGLTSNFLCWGGIDSGMTQSTRLQYIGCNTLLFTTLSLMPDNFTGQRKSAVRLMYRTAADKHLQWINSFLCAPYFIHMIRFWVEKHCVPVRKLLYSTSVYWKWTLRKNICFLLELTNGLCQW